jgi:hypothetical protein
VRCGFSLILRKAGWFRRLPAKEGFNQPFGQGPNPSHTQ